MAVLIALLIAVLWWLLPVYICSRMALQKGKSTGLWVFLAFLFGWLSVLVLAGSASER